MRATIKIKGVDEQGRPVKEKRKVDLRKGQSITVVNGSGAHGPKPKA
jgi:hypothetical protein